MIFLWIVGTVQGKTAIHIESAWGLSKISYELAEVAQHFLEKCTCELVSVI